MIVIRHAVDPPIRMSKISYVWPVLTDCLCKDRKLWVRGQDKTGERFSLCAIYQGGGRMSKRYYYIFVFKRLRFIYAGYSRLVVSSVHVIRKKDLLFTQSFILCKRIVSLLHYLTFLVGDWVEFFLMNAK